MRTIVDQDLTRSVRAGKQTIQHSLAVPAKSSVHGMVCIMTLWRFGYWSLRLRRKTEQQRQSDVIAAGEGTAYGTLSCVSMYHGSR